MKKNNAYRPYEMLFKRFVDILCCIAALLVFGWIYIIVAILVKIKLGSPIVFKQARPGKDEKIFYLYKFRTMTDEKDENGNLLPGEKRLTKFGRLLRSTSLDELPETFNILKGDMSIIGPRPLAVEYLPYYTEEERKRHSVRPGLSGLAQAKGRNSLSWEEKFQYDIDYVNNITFIGDCKIILLTVKKFLMRSDIGQGEESPESFHTYRQKQKEKVTNGGI